MIVYFICDESGAKGYADRPEQCPGETGVFAGYFIPEPLFEDVSAKLEATSSRYFSTEKPHLRDLSPDQSSELRSSVFSIIRTWGLPCTYEAIHVQGLNLAHQRILEIDESARKARTSPTRISWRPRPRLLQNELFQGLFCKAAAFFFDNCSVDRDVLTIFVDKVDASILEQFRLAAREMTDFGPRTVEVKGWDPKEKKVVHGEIRFGHKGTELPVMKRMRRLHYEIELGADHLVLAADVLANSIQHIFRTRPPQEVGRPLHTASAIRDHELRAYFYGLMGDEGREGLWFSDSILMHPDEESRIRGRT